MMTQAIELRKRPHVIIATPGRLVDLVRSNQGEWSLGKVKFLVSRQSRREEIETDEEYRSSMRQIVSSRPRSHRSCRSSLTSYPSSDRRCSSLPPSPNPSSRSRSENRQRGRQDPSCTSRENRTSSHLFRYFPC
jgi:hypothetical protein